MAYQDINNDGVISAETEIKEENHYYPFGLKHKGYNNQITGRDHNYGYNGIEESNELGNNMLEMDLRQYDPAIARWIVIDPVTHHNFSPYQAFDNNPIFWADPSGADAAYNWGSGQYENSQGEAISFDEAMASHGLNTDGSETCDDCPSGSHEDGSEWIAPDGSTYIYNGQLGRWSDVPAIYITVTKNINKGKNAKIAKNLMITGIAVNSKAAKLDGELLIMDAATVVSYALISSTAMYFSYKAITELDYTTDISVPKNKFYITLYRGVHGKHPDFFNALRGAAYPYAMAPIGHMSRSLHNSEDINNYKSIFTSWTTSLEIARMHAYKKAPIGGVVLMKRFSIYRTVPSPDIFEEGEVLIPGIVTGAKIIN